VDLSKFLLALVSDWISLMSGIASVILTIIGIAKKWTSIPRWVFWLASVICFFFASARIWTTEHRNYLAEAAEHEAKLDFKFQEINTGSFAPEKDPAPIFGGDAMITVAGTMFNAGLMPSIVTDWELLVTIPGDNTPHKGEFFGSEAKTIVFHTQAGAQGSYSWEHAYLPDLTATDGIDAGKGKVGFIVFHLPGVKLSQVQRLGVVYDLSWQDVNGKKYHKEFTPAVMYDSPRYIPGMPRSETPSQ
jgi:hypothetical protein